MRYSQSDLGSIPYLLTIGGDRNVPNNIIVILQERNYKNCYEKYIHSSGMFIVAIFVLRFLAKLRFPANTRIVTIVILLISNYLQLVH